jgi:preprotein translocase subunit SecA
MDDCASQLLQQPAPAPSGSRAPVPSEIWRRLSGESARRAGPLRGLDGMWNTAAGHLVARRRGAEHFLARARQVLDLESRFTGLTDANLTTELQRARASWRLGRDDAEELIVSFALIRESAARVVGMRPHLEQVAAGLAIHDRNIAEMATGEGKTLAVSMPAVVAAWRGRGCHVMTFNHYLAARDAAEMKPVYDFCGVTVRHIEQGMEPDERRIAYEADLTYCTSKDVAADYLLDRIALGQRTGPAANALADLVEGAASGTGRLLLRGLDTAIVDEADSVLIDEGVTPLIISGDAPNDQQVQAYGTAALLAEDLEEGEHYILDERDRIVSLTDAGRTRLEGFARPLGSIWAAARRREEYATQAIFARAFMLRDREYVIEDGKVVIVDEATGRLLPDRMWRAGLHQAVEAKEGLEVNPPKDTLARVSFQRFFRMYRRLGGTTGTAREARTELWQIYGLSTVVLPTHRPCLRRLDPDRIFPSRRAKWAAVVEEIEKVHAGGQPILAGTCSVEASALLSRRLAEIGLPHEIVNAVRHADEARIVACAGERGRITVATNMAGRGTDIKLGPGVAELGGLHVIATERHESGRIDRQLIGRSARQGDPGSAAQFVSLEDEICRRYLPRALQHFGRHGRGGARLVEMAQRRAERLAARQRRRLLRADDWLDRLLGFAGREH